MRLLAALLLLPALARPVDEDALFGGEAAPPAEAPKPAEEAPSDALQVGGVYYQQVLGSAREGLAPKDLPLSAPLQFDGFLDARPNDRLRGFLRARLLHDPTRDAYGNPTRGAAAPLPSALTPVAAPLPDNPRVVLDQAWLKWDLGRAVFLTAGKQQLKWGTARIWNPTDFLSAARRNPLEPYDLRLGSSMLKAELPWEAARANLYALALFDNPAQASTLGQIGGAFRAEFVLGEAEFGLDAVTRDGLMPAYGADLSMGLGPFDAYAEAALLHGAAQVPRFNAAPSAGADLSTLIGYSAYGGPLLQASAGLEYAFAWRENRRATLGAEYFYNEAGVEDAKLYPALIYFGSFQPFYVSKHYGALFLTAEGPDELKHSSYTLSALGNLNDLSAVARLDLRWQALSYLTWGAFVSGHFGSQGGEFNFSIDTPAYAYGSTPIPPVRLAATPVEFGLSLRLAF